MICSLCPCMPALGELVEVELHLPEQTEEAPPLPSTWIKRPTTILSGTQTTLWYRPTQVQGKEPPAGNGHWRLM